MTHEIETLLDEVRLLYHRMVQVAEDIHRDEPVTLGMCSVLEFLLKNGSTTVPDIARGRFVTRQHIQTLVNTLLKGEFVTLEDNPSHKRSSMIGLTSNGARLIRRMRRREEQIYEAIDIGLSQDWLVSAREVLKDVRGSLGQHSN
jgi:DNA-binding MarR family transcriptional regulator